MVEPGGRHARIAAKNIPTVLLVHALTGSAEAGGPDGWWAPLLGPGRAIDPAHYRILCFNNLGSCYGSSGPGVVGFPTDKNIDLTSLDISRALLLALDKLGIDRVHLTAGVARRHGDSHARRAGARSL